MRVIQTIQGSIRDPKTDRLPEPVEMQFYNGDDHVEALAAMVSATASANRPDAWFTVLAVRIEF